MRAGVSFFTASNREQANVTLPAPLETIRERHSAPRKHEKYKGLGRFSDSFLAPRGYSLLRRTGAVGAQVVGQVRPKVWSVPGRPGESQEVYGKDKFKWEL